MTVCVVGLGYVGLSMAACLASRNISTVGVERDASKLSHIAQGMPPFYEPRLRPLLRSVLASGFLRCTRELGAAVRASSVVFVAVGTPSRPNGSADLRQVKAATAQIAGACKEERARQRARRVIAVRSTVPPGTLENVLKPLFERRLGQAKGESFWLCSNPEFLREGSAIEDTLRPDRIVIGALAREPVRRLTKIYEGLCARLPKILVTSPTNAELIKFANNAFLATKISFINSLAALCERLPKADVNVVADGLGLDPRINPAFLRAGLGFGGSCLPKDLRALISFTKHLRCDARLFEAAYAVNAAQPQRAVRRLRRALGGLVGKRVAVLGLAFKPGTDDMREAPAIRLVQALRRAGATVAVTDPKALKVARMAFGRQVAYRKSALACLEDADAAVLATEWRTYSGLHPEDFQDHLRSPVFVDGRRLFDATRFGVLSGFLAVGRGPP